MMSPEIRNSRVGLHFSAIERNEFSANRSLLLFVFCQFRTVFERRYVYVRNGFLFVLEKVGSKLYINSAIVLYQTACCEINLSASFNFGQLISLI